MQLWLGLSFYENTCLQRAKATYLYKKPKQSFNGSLSNFI